MSVTVQSSQIGIPAAGEAIAAPDPLMTRQLTPLYVRAAIEAAG